MTARYAAGTDVTADRSRVEIERTLTRYGATSFASGWDEGRAMLAFAIHGRQVRLMLAMPDRQSREITHTPKGQRRSGGAIQSAYEQAVRQRWRALVLIVKAKLEAVAAGVVTFDEEFGMHMVLPNGATVAEHVIPAMVEAYATGQVAALLPPMKTAIEGSQDG